MIRKFFGLIASFFLFAAFILSLFVMIGQLSNKAFLNLIYFVKANNRQYNLAYGFGLWSYCEGAYDAHVDQCSKATPGYDWYRTPGFSDMLPEHAASTRVRGVFLGMFILYFIVLGFSFLLWLLSLPFGVFFCFPRLRNNPGGRPLDVTMATWSGISCVISFVALIIAIVYVVSFNRNISNASIYWNGHAGIALWFSIGIVIALFLAMLFYAFKSCFSGGSRRIGDEEFTHKKRGRRQKQVQPEQPFDLAPHQPYVYNNADGTTNMSQPNTPLMVNQTYQQQPTIPQTQVPQTQVPHAQV